MYAIRSYYGVEQVPGIGAGIVHDALGGEAEQRIADFQANGVPVSRFVGQMTMSTETRTGSRDLIASTSGRTRASSSSTETARAPGRVV